MKNMQKLSIIALILFSSLKLFSNYENNFKDDLKAENQKKTEEISDWKNSQKH